MTAKIISASMAALLRFHLTGEATPGVEVATASVRAAWSRGYFDRPLSGGMAHVSDAGRAALAAYDEKETTP